MGFEKGHEKQGGRKKGTPNKSTMELRAVLKEIIDSELEMLPNRLEQLSDKERLDVVIKLMPFALPRVKAVAFNKGEPISFDIGVY